MSRKEAAINILLVEDDETEYMLAQEAFKNSRLNHRITRLENGQDLLDYLLARGRHAKRVIDKRLPCLILLDMKMPVMNGPDTLKALKKDPALRKLPVVMLTNSNAREDVAGAYALGANAYVRKPSNFDEFVAAANALKLFLCGVAELPLPLDLPGNGSARTEVL